MPTISNRPLEIALNRALFAGILLAAGLLGWALFGLPFTHSDRYPLSADEPKQAPLSTPKPFSTWPAQKPEAVLVLTGQMHAFLQKCGCSDPQKGGLERRYNFIQDLKAKNWDVLPLDLGGLPADLAQPKKVSVPGQSLLKYKAAMESLKVMDYKGIGVAIEEIALPWIEGLSHYTLQPGNKYPEVLTSNLSINGLEPLLTKSSIYPVGKLKVGVAAVVGSKMKQQMMQIDDKLKFSEDGKKVLDDILKDFQANGVNFRVLLFNNSEPPRNNSGAIPVQNLSGNDPSNPNGKDEWKSSRQLAEDAAKYLPDAFDVIVCRSDETEPARETKRIGKTTILQVGQRGQYVGALGVFRNPDGSNDLRFELVAMMPEYDTPKGSKTPVIDELEKYAVEVKQAGLLAKLIKKQHNTQLSLKTAAYVGSLECKSCHQKEYAQYMKLNPSGRAHSVAYSALENAVRPANRQFDPECIVCHTVGYEYVTGFADARNTAQKQLELKNVGCENCHGPGSVHVEEEKSIAAGQIVPRLSLPYLSPWKVNGKGAMPDEQKLKKFMDGDKNAFNELEYTIFQRVDRLCFGCHNEDTDPHFKLESFWPRVNHTFAKGAIPAAPPLEKKP